MYPICFLYALSLIFNYVYMDPEYLISCLLWYFVIRKKQTDELKCMFNTDRVLPL